MIVGKYISTCLLICILIYGSVSPVSSYYRSTRLGPAKCSSLSSSPDRGHLMRENTVTGACMTRRRLNLMKAASRVAVHMSSSSEQIEGQEAERSISDGGSAASRRAVRQGGSSMLNSGTNLVKNCVGAGAFSVSGRVAQILSQPGSSGLGETNCDFCYLHLAWLILQSPLPHFRTI